MLPLALCAIFRNEAPYLREWIEFHRLVGVERFHLYQNCSNDDYNSVLGPYLEEGIVELIDWPNPPPCQLQAYQHFISNDSKQPGWVAFIDCDEFLFSPCYPTVNEALESIAAPEWGAVGVNWMCFGASGQEKSAPGLVTERFVMRPADNFAANRHIKSIVRRDRVEGVGSNPHQFKVNGGTFSASGQALAGPFSAVPQHSLLRVHHYHTKSREEFLRKIQRGNADGRVYRSPAEFERYQAMDIEDLSARRFLARLEPRTSRRPERERAMAAGARISTSHATLPKPVLEQPPPRDFASYRGFHQDETMLVCGCGSSLSTVVAPERFPTIGVNDVGRLFHPDYLVVVNPRTQFSGDRFHYVETSLAQTLFTQLDLGIDHPNVVRFRLGRRGGTDLSDPQSLPYTRNSPYVALCLALHMGARRIGLIGVDFTDHHFFAKTGRHALVRELNQINNEYTALAQSCRRLGLEVFNLSPDSCITAFPRMTPEEFSRGSLVPASAPADLSGARAFFVNYRFLSCGEVFADGLRHAAEDLRVQSASAWWDDSTLAGQIESFAPDLLFVVHGRKFSQRRMARACGRHSAVWLLDEPYEVDDTARFAASFDTVFVNDPATLQRHRNAHYLPVCYDPALYHYQPGTRKHRVGFIGGANPAREARLVELARHDLLSYTVGGPWRSPELRKLQLAPNVPATESAKLYRQTRIVLNVFRTEHHFNREQLPAVSLNPRIYEALACGALVVSERRPEIEQICPELPVFDDAGQMRSVIEGLLGDPVRFESIRRACIRRLAGHTYANRLFTALTTATGRGDCRPWKASTRITALSMRQAQVIAQRKTTAAALPGWRVDQAAHVRAECIDLYAQRPPAPGSEVGLSGNDSYAEVCLSFEVQTHPDTTFVAKIHQAEQHRQISNSYHLMLTGPHAYLARHDHIVHSFTLATGPWHAVALSWQRGTLCLRIGGKVECLTRDTWLPSGYCFLGAKAGTASIRHVQLSVPDQELAPPAPPCIAAAPHEVLYDSGAAPKPRVSIISTVYDRVGCLDACLRSVQGLAFDDYEHLIVADAPTAAVLAQIRSLVADSFDGRHRLRLAVLRTRANDWGMTPAAVGISLATGAAVCFLSDDNGYKPEHFAKLVAVLDEDPRLGFVYSSCLYDGRATLNSATPAYGRIDLGQPLLRREVLERHLTGRWPMRSTAWDWKMIETLTKGGVRWKHVAETTFLFRLAKYPQFAPPPRRKPADATARMTARLSATANAPAVTRTYKNAEPRHFAAPPLRNLLYHVWPVRGSMWRWNIAQLKQRIALFNGRRLISIAHDHRSEIPGQVEDALSGCGCEFIVVRNRPAGESATFPAMLRRIASQDPDEATFYAHAKGVKYEPTVPPTIRRWTEMSYRAALDDWPVVAAQLERYAFTGSFRRFGRFKAHRDLCDWHYHGTFFWMRHAAVFAKDCFQVPPFYAGVEAWPGLHFSREQSGCLLLDDLGEPATNEHFWTAYGTEIERWESQHPKPPGQPSMDDIYV